MSTRLMTRGRLRFRLRLKRSRKNRQAGYSTGPAESDVKEGPMNKRMSRFLVVSIITTHVWMLLGVVVIRGQSFQKRETNASGRQIKIEEKNMTNETGKIAL